MKLNDIKSFIIEANVLNDMEPVPIMSLPVSLSGYLDTFAKQVKTANSKELFNKKLKRLLHRDERFFEKITKPLPDAMPDWAHKAQSDDNLYGFVPSNELNDTITHILHYVQALEQDLKSSSNDIKVFANREIEGLLRAENFALIVDKSNKYFARGAKKASTKSIEGLVHIMDASNGYAWYMIKDTEAFKREGKVLQNCIGSHYTPERCAQNDTQIVILKTESGDSVIAMRIVKGKISEVKGKNNKTPIPKYAEFLPEFYEKQKHKLKGFDSYALRELSSGGYYFIEEQNKIVTKQTAIKEYVKTTLIKNLDSGYTVNSISTGSSQLTKDLYNISHDNIVEIFELRDKNGNPILSALRDSNHHISKIESHRNDVFGKNFTSAFIDEIMSLPSVRGTDQKVTDQLLWDAGILLNKDNTKSKIIKLSENISEIKKSKNHEWQVYSEPYVIKELSNNISTKLKAKQYSGNVLFDKVYISNQTGKDPSYATKMIIGVKDGIAQLYVSSKTSQTDFGLYEMGATEEPSKDHFTFKDYVSDVFPILEKENIKPSVHLTLFAGALKNNQGKYTPAENLNDLIATELNNRVYAVPLDKFTDPVKKFVYVISQWGKDLHVAAGISEIIRHKYSGHYPQDQHQQIRTTSKKVENNGGIESLAEKFWDSFKIQPNKLYLIRKNNDTVKKEDAYRTNQVFPFFAVDNEIIDLPDFFNGDIPDRQEDIDVLMDQINFLDELNGIVVEDSGLRFHPKIFQNSIFAKILGNCRVNEEGRIVKNRK